MTCLAQRLCIAKACCLLMQSLLCCLNFERFQAYRLQNSALTTVRSLTECYHQHWHCCQPGSLPGRRCALCGLTDAWLWQPIIVLDTADHSGVEMPGMHVMCRLV